MPVHKSAEFVLDSDDELEREQDKLADVDIGDPDPHSRSPSPVEAIQKAAVTQASGKRRQLGAAPAGDGK